MPEGEISGKVKVSVDDGGGKQLPRVHLTSSTTMKALAEMLSVGVVGRPVVDLTGLKRTYDVAVDLSMDDAMNVARSAMTLMPGAGGGVGDAGDHGVADPSGSLIFGSVEMLGLKLDARKLPIDLLVIDHVEKMPTAN